MIRYVNGFFRNLINPATSLLSLIDNSHINRYAKVYRFARIVNSYIGRYSYIGINTWIENAEIGQFCSIASDVYIGLASHTINFLSTSPLFTEKHNATGYSWTNKDIVKHSKRTFIGNDVWIGYRALIKDGIHIGNGAIIGAGAVVTKDVPPYAIVAGVPASIIRYRFSNEIVEKLEQYKWWSLNTSDIKAKISLFQKEVDSDFPLDI